MSGLAIPAQALALALVRACKRLGENAELVASGACPQSRAAYHALCALNVVFGEKPRAVTVLEAAARDWGVPFECCADRYDWWAGERVDDLLIASIITELST